MGSMNGLESPCYKCEDRHVGCHSTCETYKEYCAEYEEIRKKVDAKKAEVKMMDDFRIRCVERSKKRIGSKKPFGQR